ncbi:MAG TPA: hypothetical protein VKD08_02530 [Ignavibacteriaceae bacterium]|jgi:hypothetical protein|nr:hypothetical protein [Ignavibacteriaceae bacterium]
MNGGENSLRQNYSFTQREFEKILNMFSVLQKDITSARNLPDKTRTKLFEKLEEMILQFDISMNNLDVFWAFIGRTGIAYKVYEKGIVPESLIEFTKTIWQIQCREEGRPPQSDPPIKF